MKTAFAIAATVCILVAGCAAQTPTATLKRSTDPYSGKPKYAFGPIETQDCAGATPTAGKVALSVLGVDDLHALALTYSGHGWLFLNPASPLDMLIDGKSHQMIAIQRPSREVVYGSQVTESLYYPITKAFVQKLATAKRLQFRVLGSKGSAEACLGESSLKSLEAVVPLVP